MAPQSDISKTRKDIRTRRKGIREAAEGSTATLKWLQEHLKITPCAAIFGILHTSEVCGRAATQKHFSHKKQLPVITKTCKKKKKKCCVLMRAYHLRTALHTVKHGAGSMEPFFSWTWGSGTEVLWHTSVSLTAENTPLKMIPAQVHKTSYSGS